MQCGTGFKSRNKPIAVEAVGTGECKPDDDVTRLEYEECNTEDCFVPEDPTDTKVCDTKLDVILLLDGSGSLGPDGWKAVQQIGSAIANALVGGENNVQLAVQVFSGPGTIEGVYRCLGYMGPSPDMDTDCNIKWVSHFSTETGGVAKKIESFAWPGRTTLTSAALALAEAELKYSRKDAQSVVVCITDGVPMDDDATAWAAWSLRQKASLVFVPVGNGAPREGINQWASSPVNSHVIDVEDFETLGAIHTVNDIISDLCPMASFPDSLNLR